MKSIGTHLIMELWGCSNLESASLVEKALRDVVTATKTTLMELTVVPFTPVGVTAVAVVAESHISIHTWPELGYAAVDVFTCGDAADPDAAIPVLKDYFKPDRVHIMEMKRGLPSE